MIPYLGVLPLVVRAWKSALYAPQIWTVEARDLAWLRSDLVNLVPNGIINKYTEIGSNDVHLLCK